MLTAGILAIFILTYVSMAIGRIPGLRTDRAGLALVAAVLMIVITGADLRRTAEWVDLSTLALLFGLMVLSAQFGICGFWRFLAICGVPALIGLGVIICWPWRGRWQVSEVPQAAAAAARAPELHRWSLAKAVLVTAALLVAFGMGAPRPVGPLYRRRPVHEPAGGDASAGGRRLAPACRS